ncbi:DUF4233 domain-containing protein [Flaviflexus salsibiostraticola]|uniref:DUF4233 domain-containing protein n=1 Tax=Flaviflexus salsibiostraticola TaxID=1282737 RepID=A0A3Q8WT78_9ACTO|nr:DUF4233 domain-containing protein [Flaviflexus salsibiostraticola]AZN29742.1 DUF4233 domain-containing protein [Flaviflexus salsibiostraticola]
MARDPRTAPIPKGSALSQFTMTMLILEIFVVLFAGVAAFGLRLAAPGTVWALTGIGMLVLLIAAIVLGRSQRAGIILGSFAQTVVLVTGVWMPAGFAVGLSFLVLWSASIYWGMRLDREREQRRAEQAAWEAEQEDQDEQDVSGD